MPGAPCTVPGCKNSSQSCKLRMVRYPRDEIRRKTWLKIIGRPDWNPYKEARICEAHFSSEQWKSSFRLKGDAVPRPLVTIPCTCSNEFKSILGDHSYAKKASPSCQVHGCTSSTLQELSKENMQLQKKVCGLQKELYGKSEDTFSTPLKSIENINSRKKYTAQDIKKGLSLRFSCGTTGYNSVRKSFPKEAKLPSVRLLQMATEKIKFRPGVLHEVFEAMQSRFSDLSDVRDRDVVLVFDELAIKKRIDLDQSTGQFIGYGTIPGHEHLHAEKGEVYVMRGCRRKFKQLVAYHLNPPVVEMAKKKEVILQLLEEAKKIGANVVAIVCDCGNRGLLRELGFCTQRDFLKYCINNPVAPERKLWCVADPVHIFKSLKECLCTNRYLELPAWFVSKFNLPSAMVDVEHIEWLEKFQRDDSLRLVPGLTFKDLSSTHFSKMKVRSSHKVINHKVGSALSYLVLKGLVPEAFESTAVFIKLMNRWFELTTSRNCQVALGLKNEEAYNSAIQHLELVAKVFEGIKIGVSGGWKPVQSHIIFTTKSLLEVTQHLIKEKNYEFVLTGNFTSDVAENIVSRVRINRPTPSSLELKTRLKHLAISQFNDRITTSSYDHDDAEDLVDLLSERYDSILPEQEVDPSNFKWRPSIPTGAFKAHVEDVLYRMCGYVVVSLKKKGILKCAGCISALEHKDDVPHPNALFQILTDYKCGAQFAVSDILFRLLRLIEFNLLQWAPQLQRCKQLNKIIDSVVQPAVEKYFPLGSCHDVKTKIVKAYCTMRLRQLGVHDFSPSESLSSSCLSSRTAGGEYLTAKYVLRF